MTPTQIQHWDEARQRSDFTNYDNQVKRPNMRPSSVTPDIGYKIINENEYEGNFQKIVFSGTQKRTIVRVRARLSEVDRPTIIAGLKPFALLISSNLFRL